MTDSFSNIRQVVEAAVARSPDNVYLVCGDEEVTYRDFDRRINRAANGFLRLGVRKGDRVALMLPNRPEFLYAWLGLSKIGGSMVPINTAFKSREAHYVIDHSESRFLLADARYLDVLCPILCECPHLESTIALYESSPGSAGVRPASGGRGGRDARAPRDFPSFANLMAQSADALEPTEVSEDDEAS